MADFDPWSGKTLGKVSAPAGDYEDGSVMCDAALSLSVLGSWSNARSEPRNVLVTFAVDRKRAQGFE
eukprot:5528234-Amphidinium_carterae.1